MKRKINENQKVTLTIGQLKRLVRESGNDSDGRVLRKLKDLPLGCRIFCTDAGGLIVFCAETKNGLAEFLPKIFLMDEGEAKETADELWSLKPLETHENVWRYR